MRPALEQVKSGRDYAGDLAAALGGAVFPFSLSPFGIWPLALVSPLLLYTVVARCSVRRCLLRFYLYNLALFGVGVSWIFVSVHEYGGASALLAACLVALFVGAYALICLPQAWIFARWFRGGTAVRALGFAALWVLQEWLRSWFLTGFPWLFSGYGVMGTPLAAYAPLTGVFGVSLVALLLVTTCHAAVKNPAWLLPAAALVLGGWVAGQVSFTRSEGRLSVSLIQENIDQHEKWRPENRRPILNRYGRATAGEWGRDLIVWPEAAVTVFSDEAQAFLEALDRRGAGAGSTLVFGIPGRDGAGGFQNTVMALGAGHGQYIKRRLVPFGEYVPLEAYLRGLIAFFDLPMSRNSAGPDRQEPLIASGLRLSASVCYEVVYPDLVRTTAAAPDLLLTVSNDTWFGNSMGPWQHLQMARMRAMENARSMVRATNNGVTALIDHRGRLTATLPQFTRGVLRGQVEVRSGSTPFHRLGSYPTLLICLLMLALAWRHGRAPSGRITTFSTPKP